MVACAAGLAACGITLEVRSDDDADGGPSSSSGTVDGSATVDATTSSSGGNGASSSSSGAPCATRIEQATACAAVTCGRANDGCGGTYQCDDHCATNEAPNAMCVPGTNTCTCQQSECAPAYQCGDIPSGCGDSRSCGSCSAIADCDGDRHVCECKQISCGADCFNYRDCDDGNLGCECNGPGKCIMRNDNSIKVCCVPVDFNTACGGGPFGNEAVCRFRSDGCGGFFDCGQCPTHQHCVFAAANFCAPDP